MDLYCEGCGMLLDAEGCDDIGAIPPVWIGGEARCSSTCGRASKCTRCTRGLLASAAPVTIGGREYCGGHCAAADQVERSDAALARSRDAIGLDAVAPRVHEVGARWER